MTYPAGQTFTFKDGGIGLAIGSPSYPMVCGCSSSGVANTLYKFGSSVDAIATLGVGPGVELAAVLADLTGCLYFELTNGVAGSSSAVTAAPIGTGTGTITLAGTPTGQHDVAIEITATGDLGVGRFRYTLEYSATVGGRTWSPEIVIPSGGTYVLGDTGVTMTFVPGAGPTTFEDGDLHTFTDTAPHYTAANVASAFATLDAQIENNYFDQVYFTGVNETGADAATMAAAVDTVMTTLEGKFYFARALLDAGSEDAAADVKSDTAAFTSTRVGLCFGYGYTSTKVPAVGWGTPKLPILNAFAERAAGADLSENLGRKMSGALRGVTYITHDEARELDFIEEDKINTARTYRGEPGFYAINGYLHSPMGSDYLYFDWGRTMDRIARIQYLAQNPFLLAKLVAKTDGTGNLTEASARRVEAAVRSRLKSAVRDPINVEGDRGHVSGLAYVVDRTNDFLATRTIITTTSAVPLSPVENIASTLGFARSL